MMQASGFSLWLMPKGDIYSKLADLIFKLSKKYSTPYFEPHVTLIGGFVIPKKEAVRKSIKLASVISPFTINLGKTDYLKEYFKCLFVRVKENKNISGANLKAKEIFDIKNDNKYMPHLSLVYGDIAPELKKEIISENFKNFNINFMVDSIHLFSTFGQVKDWRRIKEFTLK